MAGWAVSTTDRSRRRSDGEATPGRRRSGEARSNLPNLPNLHEPPQLEVSPPRRDRRRLRRAAPPAVRAVRARPADRCGGRERRRAGRRLHRRCRRRPGQTVPAAQGRQFRRIRQRSTVGGRHDVRRLGSRVLRCQRGRTPGPVCGERRLSIGARLAAVAGPALHQPGRRPVRARPPGATGHADQHRRGRGRRFHRGWPGGSVRGRPPDAEGVPVSHAQLFAPQ